MVLKTRFHGLARLVLPVIALCWPAAAAIAQSHGPAQKQAMASQQITDSAGRVHVRPNRQRISEAQRKAAAQHRKALRSKAAPVAKTSEVKK